MHYVKNADAYATYTDPVTRLTIGRGAVVAVETLTESMKKRIRKRGLLEVSHAEYLAANPSAAPKDVPVEPVAPVEPEAPRAGDETAPETNAEVPPSDAAVAPKAKPSKKK